MKTELKANEKFEVAPSWPGINFPLAGMCHQANVCVCCDRFITGTSEIKWINETILLIHEKRLQDSDLSCLLQNCYNVLDPGLQHCLLGSYKLAGRRIVICDVVLPSFRGVGGRHLERRTKE